jgi:hypothetical protein
MNLSRHLATPTTLVAPLAAALSLTLLSPPALAAETSVAPAQPGTPAYDRWLGQQLGTLQRLHDESALRNLMYAYGRGNDEISLRHADRSAGRQRGAAEYTKAFTPATRVEVYALGGDKPIGQTTGVPAWVDFVDQYYAGNGYSSTLHLMSNFDIGFDGKDRATVSAYALAPHFLLRAVAKDKASADTAVEWMLCRYAVQAERQANGSWKITKLQINLEEISRAAGFFPGGQRHGR